MKIALLGFGTVGTGVYDIIKTSTSPYVKNIEISKILIRNEAKLCMDIMTLNFDDILKDDSIELIVEVMGGMHPAYEYIMASLKSGKHVVSANKAVIAAHLKEFTKTAAKNKVSFLCEASAGGGIPWLKSIKQVRRIDEITELHGIFNGTSNFILHNMFEDECSFDEMLKIAQDKGYAESDPSADIDGDDIRRKLSIASSLAYDAIIPEDSIPVSGIRQVNKMDIRFFKELKMTLKLAATSVRSGNRYCACVEPVLYPNSSIEANVPDNYNIGSLTGTSVGKLKFYGQGAGKLPTGNAIIQDIIDISTGGDKNYPYRFDKKLKRCDNLLKGRYYVRYENESTFDILRKAFGNTLITGSLQALITDEIPIGDACALFSKIKETEPESFHARFA